MSKTDIITMGCRLNIYESEVIRAHMTKAGLDNAVIINSCAVTSEAVRQTRQVIRKQRRKNPSAQIIVTGCAAQIEPERFAAMPEVDVVLGNQEKLETETFTNLNQKSESVQVADIMTVRKMQPITVSSFGSRARSYVQIQNGCDHRCTFCIIPFGRGPSRSISADEVIDQIKKLVNNGYKEVVLTGVDISAYGDDLADGFGLGELVRQILTKIPDLPRLRLSSIDCAEIDEVLLAMLAQHQRLMPHLHLSLQAGDDVILKRMKRRHTRDDAIAFCDKVRKLRPDIVFGADLIAGFPTETDDMFNNTLKLVGQCGLTHLHVFPFSPRPGTPAAKMPQVNGNVIRDRARKLRELGDRQLQLHLQSMIGTRHSILVETGTSGHTPHFVLAQLATEQLPGTLIEAEIISQNTGQILARPVI